MVADKDGNTGSGAGTDNWPAARHPTPEYRAHLLQSHLTSAKRGNPNGVGSCRRQWAQDGPRSERHLLKGTGKP